MTNNLESEISDQLLAEKFPAFQTGLRVKFGDTIFRSWMADLNVLELSDRSVVLSTPSAVKCDRLNQVYRRGIHKEWCKHIGNVDRLKIAMRSQLRESARSQSLLTDVSASDLANTPNDNREINRPSHSDEGTGMAGADLNDSRSQNVSCSQYGSKSTSRNSFFFDGAQTPTGYERTSFTQEKLNESGRYLIDGPSNNSMRAASASPRKKSTSEKDKDLDGRQGLTGHILEDLISPVDRSMHFNDFAIDASNRMAFCAATRAAQDNNAGKLIYIYGPSGFGKTHLLFSIANAWAEEHPNRPYAYFTYSDMRNGCASAARSSALHALHQELSGRQLILIDDLHLLLSCVRTQEEILNLANRFSTSGRQLVIAGETSPARLLEAGLNARLADRLAGGVPAPIEAGGDDLRRDVLLKRRDTSKVHCIIGDDAIDFIVQNFTNSIREAIGAFNQLELLYGERSDTVGVEEARAALKSRLREVHTNPTLEDALKATSSIFEISLDDLRGRKQPQRIARARHAFVMVGREALNESFPRLGKTLKRDHTTVMSSYDRAQALFEREESFRTKIAAIRDRIGAS
ncbi:MAG: DnaA/Hda family protein [Pseudomonadota bacterium]